jgi:two-component system, sensor histidine kinase
MKKTEFKTTDQEIRAEQIRLLYNHFTFMSLANLPCILILGYMVSSGVGAVNATLWTLFLLISIGLRIHLTRRFNHAKPGDNEIDFWGRQAILSMLVSGLVWSVLPHLAAKCSLTVYLITTLFISFMATIFLAPGSTYKKAFFVFAGPILVSTGFSFLLLSHDYWFITLALLLGLAILSHLSVLLERTMIESIRIRFENQALIEQLSVQKREAEKANIAKSKFLAAASHDLRQPLHALGLYLDTMTTELNTPRQEELANKMGIAIDALNDLFQRLLDISKLDAGIVEPSVNDCPINELFKRLEIRFSPLSKQKNLEIQFIHANESLFTDPLLLERILDNLIGNAIRYTQKGKIVVAARNSSGGDGSKVLIEVSDTGPGIPSYEQENIFNEFYQLHNPERDRTKGLGLGLSIVRRLCTLLGYALELESELGNGTKFRLTIPAGNPRNIVASPETKVRSGWDIKGSHILVIDDEAEIRDAMRQLLSNWGCNAVCVDSVSEAKAIIRSGLKPDLVIADYRLRESQTGVEAIRAVIDIMQAKIPGILITGDTAPERLQEAARSGFKLLHKPVNPGQLRMVVNVLLA